MHVRMCVYVCARDCTGMSMHFQGVWKLECMRLWNVVCGLSLVSKHDLSRQAHFVQGEGARTCWRANIPALRWCGCCDVRLLRPLVWVIFSVM